MRWRLFLSLMLALPFAAVAQAQDTAQTVLHLLDYVAVDYAGAVEKGRIKEAGEYAEMREFAGQVHALIRELPANSARAQLLSDAAVLAQRIDTRADASEIAAKANTLRWAVIRTYDIPVTPKSAPDLRQGARLYAAQCAGCHGAEGRGDGIAGKTLDPAPSNFHDAGRMASRSVYGLYNTITFGVKGTGMASYRQLSEMDRWALAFYVASFADKEETRDKGGALWTAGKGRDHFPDLKNVVALAGNDIEQRFGNDGIALQAYLRAHPEAVTSVNPAPLEFAAAMIDKSLGAYRAGRHAEATQLAIQAYLEGFELTEAGLRNLDAALMERTEKEMMAYRGLLQTNASVTDVEEQAKQVQNLLAEAHEKLGGVRLSRTTTFVSALVILLREGAEAILVVAAMLAFLARAGRADARRWVHAGWIGALVLGLITWGVSNHLVAITGAGREVTEGVTALIAAAMLLYVGYWLHSKSHSAAWQKFIRDKVGGVLTGGAIWTIAMISFLAVYREAFETVLFFQALSAQAGPEGQGMLLSGAVAAVLLLVALAWAILRASMKLPIGLFFSASGVVLLALAVVFTGQGIAALQEAGKIGADAVGFIAVPVLGIYPTLQTLVAQAAVAGLSILGLWWASRAGRSAAG